MDRVDSWLNAQVGWRRLVLVWLGGCAPSVAVGGGIWALITPSPAGFGAGFLAVAGWSVLAAFPVTVLAQAAARRKVVRGSAIPFLSWRLSLGVFFLATGGLIGVLTDQQPYWHRIHREVAMCQLLFLLPAVVFLALAIRQNRRLARQHAAGSL